MNRPNPPGAEQSPEEGLEASLGRGLREMEAGLSSDADEFLGELETEDRASLRQAIERSLEEIGSGGGMDMDAFLKQLREQS